MTADVPKTTKVLSLRPMFSEAGGLGILVHRSVVVSFQHLSRLDGFELDVLNSAPGRTSHRI